MKLVIEIPDGCDASKIQNGSIASKKILDAVRNGTPVQPYACDCISREQAINAIENEQKKIMRSDWAIDQAKFSAMSEIRTLIADLPSVSTEKTGRWIKLRLGYGCSECSLCTNKHGIEFYRYCPNCGAKMEEVEE